MTKIKIDGIKTEEQALAAAGAGADFIGMVFALSPRQITEARAEKIAAALKDSGAKTEVVGVFVNARPGTVRKTAERCHLDWVQLSGDEPWEYCLELDRPVIKVMRVSRSQKAEHVIRDFEYGKKLLKKQRHIFVLDANVRGKYGGTGRKFDWNLAVPIAKKFPVIIAGGLNPDNVAEAIKIISPWGVDVSTGVEIKGIKNVDKIKKFIQAVREADDRT
jgi:phosphoribosylanthranilate isomerase